MTNLDALDRQLEAYPEDVRPVVKILLANQKDLRQAFMWQTFTPEKVATLTEVARYINELANEGSYRK